MTRPTHAGRRRGRSPSAPTPTSRPGRRGGSGRVVRCRRRGRARRRRAAPRRHPASGRARRTGASRWPTGSTTARPGLDVVGHSRLIYKVTAVVVLLCVASMIFRGFNFGIEFDGGDSFQAPGHQRAADRDPDGCRAGRRRRSPAAQVVGGNTVLLRTGAARPATRRPPSRTPIAKAAGVAPKQVSADAVSADWGNDITDQALIALVVFLVAVVAFLALRFQPKMAIGAMLSLLHDIVLTAGVYSLIGFEVTPSTVIGFLTILGFSLYDTVVVFDKVDENVKDLDRGARMTWSEAANLAVNQTLMRSINTSVIALLPVAGLLFVGAGLLGVGTLKDLALVLFVGLAAGTYSSIFLATPIVADLEASPRDPETGASTAALPGVIGVSHGSASGVSSDDPRRLAATDSRPVLISTLANGCFGASASTALRIASECGGAGLMNSAARRDSCMFSSATGARSSL